MKNNSSAFVNSFMLCVLVTFAVGGTAAIGMVWVRHQISTTANANQVLAAELARLERLIDEKKSLIETEQAPDKLRALNARMSLDLVPMNQVHNEHVTENTTDRLAQRAGRDAADTDRAPLPAPVALNLASVDRR
jgi:hypothetical protein